VGIADSIFLICLIAGGGLLLVSVVVGDLLGGVLDALHAGVDIGGVGLMPLVLGFISMFGVGGLFSTQVFHLSSGVATLIGIGTGFAGAGFVFLLFGVLGGTALSLLGGAMIARRAMAPIARLTATAEGIRRTRDPDRRIDVPPTDDEVAYWTELDRLGSEAERTGVGPVLHGDPNQGEAHVVHGAHVESARLNLEWARALGLP